MNTLVIQSAADQRPQWMDRCLSSAQSWAEQAQYDYQFIGDEPTPGAHGARVIFIHPKSCDGVLIELSEPQLGDDH